MTGSVWYWYIQYLAEAYQNQGDKDGMEEEREGDMVRERRTSSAVAMEHNPSYGIVVVVEPYPSHCHHHGAIVVATPSSS